MIRTLEGSQVEERAGYLVIRSPRNPTYWWGNFLLLRTSPGPGEAKAWLEQFAVEFPGAPHIAIGIDVTEASSVDINAMTATGLHFSRNSVLTAMTVHEPPQPNHEATLRRLAGDDDWAQAAELRAVLSAGEPGGEPAFLHARLAAERAVTEAGHGSWYGAFANGKLLAQLGLISDRSGIARFQNVETHPAARRKGLAGTLVWHAGRDGLNAGARTLVMVADPKDAAIRVYRSVGFADAETQVGFERPPQD